MMKRRLSLPLLAAAALASGGLLGAFAGHATVSGMRPDVVVTERVAGAYGVPVRDDPYASSEATVTPASWTSSAPAGPSDWDRGYAWGQQGGLRHASSCAIDSWSFQRGCEAAVHENGVYGEDF